MNIDGTILFLVAFFLLIILWIALALLTKGKIRGVFIVFFLVQILLGVGMTVYGLRMIQDEVYPVFVSQPEFESEAYEPYKLSDAQVDLLSIYGALTGFEILFMGDDFENRVETWYFAESGVMVEAVNGSILSVTEEVLLENIEGKGNPYDPRDYVYGLNPGTVLEASQIEEFLVTPVEEALLEDAQLYLGEDIILGFVDQQLIYVETIMVEE